MKHIINVLILILLFSGCSKVITKPISDYEVPQCYYLKNVVLKDNDTLTLSENSYLSPDNNISIVDSTAGNNLINIPLRKIKSAQLAICDKEQVRVSELNKTEINRFVQRRQPTKVDRLSMPYQATLVFDKSGGMVLPERRLVVGASRNSLEKSISFDDIEEVNYKEFDPAKTIVSVVSIAGFLTLIAYLALDSWADNFSIFGNNDR